jgi:hypothetical protein
MNDRRNHKRHVHNTYTSTRLWFRWFCLQYLLLQRSCSEAPGPCPRSRRLLREQRYQRRNASARSKHIAIPCWAAHTSGRAGLMYRIVVNPSLSDCCVRCHRRLLQRSCSCSGDLNSCSCVLWHLLLRFKHNLRARRYQSKLYVLQYIDCCPIPGIRYCNCLLVI